MFFKTETNGSIMLQSLYGSNGDQKLTDNTNNIHWVERCGTSGIINVSNQDNQAEKDSHVATIGK
jgi:hypothetical protein